VQARQALSPEAHTALAVGPARAPATVGNARTTRPARKVYASWRWSSRPELALQCSCIAICRRWRCLCSASWAASCHVGPEASKPSPLFNGCAYVVIWAPAVAYARCWPPGPAPSATPGGAGSPCCTLCCRYLARFCCRWRSMCCMRLRGRPCALLGAPARALKSSRAGVHFGKMSPERCPVSPAFEPRVFGRCVAAGRRAPSGIGRRTRGSARVTAGRGGSARLAGFAGRSARVPGARRLQARRGRIARRSR